MIFAQNDAGERREGVLFGTNEPTPCTCFSAPGGHIGVSVIDADNGHRGYPAERDGMPPVFVRHPAVAAAFDAAGQPSPFRMTLNGRTTAFEQVEALVDHPRVRVTRWRARDPIGAPQGPSRGTCQLFTYEFHRQAGVRFELLYFHENLTQRTSPTPTLSFSLVPAVTNLRTAAPHVYHALSTANLFQGFTPEEIKDAAGCHWEGVLCFETPEMAANRTTDPAAITQTAQLAHPLYTLVEHETWGLWNQVPLRFTQFQRNRDLEAAIVEGARASDPGAHLGFITNYRPPDPGAQSEYGAWTRSYNIGDLDARSLWLQHKAAMRHVNRPIWYTEDTGEPLNPETNTYPAARTFGEAIHWAQTPSNLFRRAVGRGDDGRYTGEDIGGGIPREPGWWLGHDPEHIGWNQLVDSFLLHGSFAARHLLLMLMRNMHTYTLQSHGMSEARAVGRFFIAAAQGYRVTEETLGLLKCRDLWPDIYASWQSCSPSGHPYRPYGVRVISGQEPRFTWFSWQGGIMLAGLDAALIIDERHGLNIFTGAVRTQMEEVRLAIAKALVNVTFSTAHQCGTSFFPDGQKWGTWISAGDGPTPVPIIPTLADYCNRDVFQHDSFEAAWVIFGVRVAQRIDSTLVARSGVIRGVHEPGILAHDPGGTRGDRITQYLGTG